MPFAYQPPAEPLQRRDKRLMVAVGGIIVLAFAGVGSWAALRPGGYGPSRDGCVTVTIPSSTGGAFEHACGARARVICRDAFAGNDRLALLTRPQCRLAGLGPAAGPEGPAGPEQTSPPP